jgi:hypothetical protein
MADNTMANQLRDARGDDIVYGGSDGIMKFYQSIRYLGEIGIARVMMAFVPNTYQEYMWMINVTPLCIRAADAMGRFIDGVCAFEVPFSLSRSPNNGTAFGFYEEQHAMNVHSERERIVQDTGLELTDLTISGVERVLRGACSHPGPFANFKNDRPYCDHCGEFVKI